MAVAKKQKFWHVTVIVGGGKREYWHYAVSEAQAAYFGKYKCNKARGMQSWAYVDEIRVEEARPPHTQAG